MIKKKWNAILRTTAIAGTLDILAAFVLNGIILNDTAPKIILQYIASPIIGDAYQGGWTSAFAGLLFHFLIAFGFTVLYFFLYPKLKLFRIHFLLSALIYGCIVWAIMNTIILPIAFSQPFQFVFKDFYIQAGTLIIMLALPIAWMEKQFNDKLSMNKN